MPKKIILVLIIIVSLGIGFVGGKLTSGNHGLLSSHHKLTAKQKGRRGHHFKKPIKGSVISINGSTLTIKLANGSTDTAYLNSSTKYTEVKSITNSSITNGSTVTVTGSKNSNGSLTAKDVVLR